MPLKLTGKQFGRLTAQKYIFTKKKQRYWLCACICGQEKTVKGSDLTSGTVKSCGCLYQDLMHHFSHTRFYTIWHSIKNRVLNKNSKDFKQYAGRGIEISEKWLKFEGFKDDMYESYQKHCEEFGEKNTSIDRINNNGNYCKENCRWATRQMQANNRRTNHLISHQGVTLTISEWSRKINVSKRSLKSRINLGWSAEEALNTPIKKYNKGIK
jgi:hypothetical protein